MSVGYGRDCLAYDQTMTIVVGVVGKVINGTVTRIQNIDGLRACQVVRQAG